MTPGGEPPDDPDLHLLVAGDHYGVWYDETHSTILVRGQVDAVTVHADGQQPPYYRTADVWIPAGGFTAAAIALDGWVRGRRPGLVHGAEPPRRNDLR